MTTEAPRSVYNERYELVGQIARGGMAEVYLARDLRLDRPVALKVLFPELSVDRNFVERFRREAQAAANLSHPNIVPVYDWGEADHTYFIVMEFIDGETLSDIIKAEAPLLPDRAAGIGAAVAAALAFAHRYGVVHRDVKPGNVLITGDGEVKVADFGIARAAGTDESLTQTGAVMGTATYFSPEQAQGEGVDARTDIYSLGVVLYEMVTGKPPFSGNNPLAIAYKHVREEPPAPRSVNPAIPPAFEAIVLKAMAKSPEDRYDTAQALRADLLRFRQGRAVQATPIVAATVPDSTRVLGAVPAGADATVVTPPTRRVVSEEQGPKRRTGAYVALLLGLLAVLAVVLFLLAHTLGLFGGSTPATASIPSVLGNSVSQATQTLQHDHFKVATNPPNATSGTVTDENPKAGTTQPTGTLVTLTVGPNQVSIPDVTGKNEADASSALQAAGFKVQVQQQPSRSAQPGVVLSQAPTGMAAQGSTVTLTVAAAPTQVTVPDVSGDTASQAGATLGRANLTPGSSTSEPSSSIHAGNVIRTSPPAGASVSPGSSVDLVTSSGSQQVTVPDVTGQSQGQAAATLIADGFRVVKAYQPTSTQSLNNDVVAQSPTGNTTVSAGSTVTITIGQYTAPTTSSPTSSSTSTTGPGGTTSTT